MSSWVVEVGITLLLVIDMVLEVESFPCNSLGKEGWFMSFYLHRREDLLVLHSFIYLFIHSLVLSYVHPFGLRL